VNAAREAWFEGQLDLDQARIVFIDETAANTKMARPECDWSPKSSRALSPVGFPGEGTLPESEVDPGFRTLAKV
jgi:hypothetical protein